MTDLINRADAIEAVRGLSVLADDEDFSYFEDALKGVPSADAVPQSEQYKKGFEDAKRAYEIELARSADRELANLKSEFESAVGEKENE